MHQMQSVEEALRPVPHSLHISFRRPCTHFARILFFGGHEHDRSLFGVDCVSGSHAGGILCATDAGAEARQQVTSKARLACFLRCWSSFRCCRFDRLGRLESGWQVGHLHSSASPSFLTSSSVVLTHWGWNQIPCLHSSLPGGPSHPTINIPST